MHTQKRKPRIGNGINQVARQKLPLRPDQEILTSKSNNANGARASGERSHAIGIEACASDDPIGGAVSRGMNNAPAARVRNDLVHSSTGLHLATERADLPHQHFADARIIGDSLLGNMNGSEAGGVRFYLAQLFGGEQAQALEAVLLAALVKRMESGDFVRACGHHHFAADVVRNRVSLTEFDHLPYALDGHPGAPRAGFIVETTMQDAAVMTTLMLRHPSVLLQKSKGGAR